MSKNTFDIFEGLPDYAVMYLQDQCRQYLTVPGVKEYVERTYNGFLQAGYSKEEAEYAVKRIVESKTLVFIDKMNQARERARRIGECGASGISCAAGLKRNGRILCCGFAFTSFILFTLTMSIHVCGADTSRALDSG